MSRIEVVVMVDRAALLERITQTPGKCGGLPCIRNMRIRVVDILETLAEGVSAKDGDFVDPVVRLGSPPQILWLTCGDITNRGLQEFFTKTFSDALELLKEGEVIVEIGRD